MISDVVFFWCSVAGFFSVIVVFVQVLVPWNAGRNLESSLQVLAGDVDSDIRENFLPARDPQVLNLLASISNLRRYPEFGLRIALSPTVTLPHKGSEVELHNYYRRLGWIAATYEAETASWRSSVTAAALPPTPALLPTREVIDVTRAGMGGSAESGAGISGYHDANGFTATSPNGIPYDHTIKLPDAQADVKSDYWFGANGSS